MLKRSFKLILVAAAVAAFSAASGQGKQDSPIDPATLESKSQAPRIGLAGSDEKLVNLSTQLPAYEQGWRDGCAAGFYQRSVRSIGAPLAGERFAQDAQQFRSNQEYTAGWGDGIRTCDTGPDRR
jgi:hypothetical protein